MTYDISSFTELLPEGLTQGKILSDVFLLIMREKDSGLHLPLLLDKAGFELLRTAMEQQHYPETRLMLKLAHTFGITPTRVVVRYTPAGGFFTTIYWQQNGMEEEHILNTELAQGVATAMEEGCPIVIYRRDFERLHNRHTEEGQVAIPLSAMSGDLLREALKLAVENDDFEMASQLRDEINNRNARTADEASEDADR